MTVRLTSAAYGQAPGTLLTKSAGEEKWLIDQGYAHVEPKVAVGPTATYTPAQDPTRNVNREDPGDAYQYGADTGLPARIETITPSSGPAAGGTVVTITGDNMVDATSVTFGGTAGTAFTKVDDNTVRATTPAKPAGAVAVAVVDPSGTTSQAAGYTYV